MWQVFPDHDFSIKKNLKKTPNSVFAVFHFKRVIKAKKAWKGLNTKGILKLIISALYLNLSNIEKQMILENPWPRAPLHSMKLKKYTLRPSMFLLSSNKVIELAMNFGIIYDPSLDEDED